MLRRVAGIFVILWFAALGSGAVERLHNAEHACEDQQAAAIAQAAGKPAPVDPIHDDSNCPVHAQLHIPTLPAGYVPLLVFLGLFVAFLTLLDRPLVTLRVPQSIACRGPPISC